MEHLSNPNNWSFLEIVSVLGLDYLRYEHKSLPLIAEQEEGDDFFFISAKSIFTEEVIETPKILEFDDGAFDLFDENNFIILEISGMGFKYINVKECNEKTEIDT